MEKNHFIYKYSFPNGKVYIGQSHKGTKRFGLSSHYKGQMVHNAMMKYPDYEKEILCYCSEEDVDDLERFYIQKYDSTNREHGYNRDSGGNKYKHVSEETKKKLSEIRKYKYSGTNNNFYGKHHSEMTKKKIAIANSKTVLQFSKDGEFIREWDSMRDIERELGIAHTNISTCCKGKHKTAGGFIFRYKEDCVA